MCNVKLVWIFLILRVVFGVEGYSGKSENVDVGFTDQSLQCQDNDNKPVDWWYIYKPPARAFIERGRYFAFLTPYSEGPWEASDVYITSSNMLSNTLLPLYQRTDESHLAVIIYTERPGPMGSAVMGILLADEEGGIWISHTVPGLPDLTQDHPVFPERELENGHLITCMTLDTATLDDIIKVLYHTEPEFTYVKVPPHMVEFLPTWSMITTPGQTIPRKSKVLEFMTHQKVLQPLLIVRKPGDPRCLYKIFAKSRKVILDVYGDQDLDHKEAICNKEFGLRKINAISIKFPSAVHYLSNTTDRAGFAVSTAAHWQRTGSGLTQYWTCIASPEKEGGKARGGMILCVQDFNIWANFANLKIKEPDC